MKEGVDGAAALAWVGSLGCMIKHGPDVAPGEPRVKYTERLARRPSDADTVC